MGRFLISNVLGNLAAAFLALKGMKSGRLKVTGLPYFSIDANLLK